MTSNISSRVSMPQLVRGFKPTRQDIRADDGCYTCAACNMCRTLRKDLKYHPCRDMQRRAEAWRRGYIAVGSRYLTRMSAKHRFIVMLDRAKIPWAFYDQSRRIVWAQRWVAMVGEGDGLFSQRVALLRRLSGNPLAQQLLLSHPDTVSSLLEAT